VCIGHSVRFHSTPFVFLTDAFTGKFLCVSDLSRGHFFYEDVHIFRCGLVPRYCGDVPPHMGIDIILY
jgi:hypothetical protein